MTKYELKGRLLDLISQVDDKAALVDIYRLIRSRLDQEEGKPSANMPEPSGPDAPSSPKQPGDQFPYPQYFSY